VRHLPRVALIALLAIGLTGCRDYGDWVVTKETKREFNNAPDQWCYDVYKKTDPVQRRHWCYERDLYNKGDVIKVRK